MYMLELLNRSGHAIEFCFKEFERNMIYKHFRGRVRVHAYIAYLGGGGGPKLGEFMLI